MMKKMFCMADITLEMKAEVIQEAIGEVTVGDTEEISVVIEAIRLISDHMGAIQDSIEITECLIPDPVKNQ